MNAVLSGVHPMSPGVQPLAKTGPQSWGETDKPRALAPRDGRDASDRPATRTASNR